MNKKAVEATIPGWMRKQSLAGAVVVFMGLAITADSNGPAWWNERGVLGTSSVAHDFQPVNQGQLKWMATQAYAEFLQELPGDGNTNILSMLEAFPAGNNHRPVNQGMLKNTALPFYDRLMVEGYVLQYPWANKPADNYALANQGQLKELFNFDFDFFDLDRDGVADNVEISLGIPPGKMDTDGDGLSDLAETWGSVYQVVSGSYNWSQAEADAVRRGGHLATITSEQEHAVVEELIGSGTFAEGDLWIGATDEVEEGVWKWITEEIFDYSRWKAGEPNNTHGTQHFAIYAAASPGQWTDWKGWYYLPYYLLELPGGLDPLNADTDGDGLADGQESTFKTSPLHADTDGDGLSDLDESNGTTDPTLADTDADGLSDSQELDLGTDPLNPDCDNDGLLDGFEVLYSRYELNKHALLWSDAKVEAAQRGGLLASVTHTNEHALIYEIFGTSKLAISRPWFGASFDPMTDSWNWESGEPLEFELWNPNGHGLIAPGKPRWGYYNGYGGFWNQCWEGQYRGSLIEYAQPLDPLNSDSDGDGLLDGAEIALGSSPFSTDSDGDGISDSDEADAGLNPAYIDSDMDWLSDPVELNGATDPLVDDADEDGLLDGEEVLVTLTDSFSADSNSNGIPDMQLYASYNGSTAVDFQVSGVAGTWNVQSNSLVLSRAGYIEAEAEYVIDVPDAGLYRFALQASWKKARPVLFNEAPMQIWIGGYFAFELSAVDGRDGRPEYIGYTPWLTAGLHEMELRIPVGWYAQNNNLSIDALELYSIDGDDADGNGIQDWIENRMVATVDTDGDGLCDYDEVWVHGTDPVSADTDGDGLTDKQEIEVYFTDPLVVDTDGDGVDDGTEVWLALTDPLVADFGEENTLVALDGSDAQLLRGAWLKEGASIYSVGLNGALEYTVNVATGGHYAVGIEVKERTGNPIGGRFDLELFADGIACGRVERSVEQGAVETSVFFPPYLESGLHTLVLEWSNLDMGQQLEVIGVSLVLYGGTDADGNGRSDWLDSRIAKSFDLEDMLGFSWVSPVCIEGSSLFKGLVSVEGAFVPVGQSNDLVRINPSVNGDWYANAKLFPEGNTELKVSHNHGANAEELLVKWEETNLIMHPTNAVTVRRNDALLLSSIPEHGKQGSMIITIEGPFGTTNLTTLTEDPVPYVFEEVGEFRLSGFYSKSRAVYFEPEAPTNSYGFVGGVAGEEVFNDANTQTVTGFVVNVVDYQLNGNPACYEGYARNWSGPGISSNTVIEADQEVSIAAISHENDSAVFRISTTSFNDRHVVARLSENGPICDHAVVSMIQQGDADFYSVLEEFGDGSRLIEITLVFGNLPPDAVIVVSLKTSGITFLDGTLEKTFTVADLDENGMLKVLMVQSEEINANCHYVGIYQGDELLIQK